MDIPQLQDITLNLCTLAPYWVVTVQGDTLAMLGHSPQDLMHDHVSVVGLVHPDDQDVVQRMMACQPGAEVQVSNLRIRQANGQIRCVVAHYEHGADAANDVPTVQVRLQDAKSLFKHQGEWISNANFRALLENTNDFIFFKNKHHVFTGASQTLVGITHGSKHWTDMIGLTDYDVFPEAFADIYYRLEKHIFLGQGMVQENQAFEGTNGQPGWVDNRKYPIKNAQGETIGLFGVARVITGAVLAEQALRQANDTLQLILDYAPIGIWLQNGQGKVGFVNKAFCQATGITEAQFMAVDNYLELIPPEFREQCAASDNKALATQGVSVTHQRLPFVDGQVHDLRVIKATKRDATNQVTALVGLSLDVTEELRQQQDLMTERDSTRQILDTVEAMILALDMDGCITLINRKGCEILGYPETELLGKNWFETCLPKDTATQQLQAVFKSALVGDHEKSQYHENPVLTRHGERRLIAWHNSIIRNASGRPVGWLSAGEDITERNLAQQQLQISERRLQHVMAITNEGVWDWHVPSGQVIHNTQWFNLLGTAPGEMSEDIDALFQLLHPHDKSQVRQRLSALLEGKSDDYQSKHRLVRPDGRTIWVLDRGRTVERDSQGKPIRVIGSFTDITYQVEHQRQLEFIAHYDALTGLPNRILLADRLHHAMAQAQRQGHTLAVAYLDLDGFKAINDQHGHDAGDRLLGALATRMRNTLRESDTLARLGGDEFVAVMGDLPDMASCLPMLKRLLTAAAEPVPDQSGLLQVSASLGVTFFPQLDVLEAEQLLRQADQAMYQAKVGGKNRYHIFDAEHDRSVRSHHEGLELVRLALAQGQFVLHYQPKVNMRTGEVIGMEALIRWEHPERGLLAPLVFLPLIADHPLTISLSQWVLHAAMAQIEAWKAMGLHLPVSVNVDAMHLQHPDFTTHLRNLQAQHPNVSAGDLELEVLETTALDDLSLVQTVIQACKELGIGFALDDFGTGYSSLTYLKRLPASLLKIDQSFVHNMLDDPEDLAILEGVLGLSRAFRRNAIAEGVESLAHGRMLLELGCELGQGYAIARPMPASNVPAWMAQWRPDALWLNHGPVAHDDLPLLFASVEHRAWITKVIHFVEGDLLSAPKLGHHECGFGQWMDAHDKAHKVLSPHLLVVDALHQAIHQLVDEVLSLKQKGHGDAAICQLPRLESLRVQWLGQLATLTA